MSTKIYNGVQIENGDILYLNNLIKKIRADMLPVAKIEFSKAKARMLECAIAYMQTGIQLDCSINDWNKLIKTINENPTLSHISFFISCEMTKLVKKNHSAQTIMEYERELDMDIKLSIMPIEGKLLGIYFIENNELEKKFRSTKEISDYAYWNNVDKPEKVSDEEWEQRKKDWDIALPGIGIPSLNGFEYLIIDTQRDLQSWITDYDTEIFPYLTDNAKLKTELAKMKLLGDKIEEFRNADKEKYDEAPTTLYFDARDYVKEHPEDVTAIAESLSVDVKKFISDELASDK